MTDGQPGDGAPLEGLADADALLGRPFPLPALPLPLVRWTEIRRVGRGAELELNLDDSRDGAPGRLALYAGPSAPPEQLPPGLEETRLRGLRVRRAALPEAQASLRPALEVVWESGGLHLRLTAQGPWPLEQVLALAASVPV